MGEKMVLKLGRNFIFLFQEFFFPYYCNRWIKSSG